MQNPNKAPLQALEDMQGGSKLVRIGLFPSPQTTTIDQDPRIRIKIGNGLRIQKSGAQLGKGEAPLICPYPQKIKIKTGHGLIFFCWTYWLQKIAQKMWWWWFQYCCSIFEKLGIYGVFHWHGWVNFLKIRWRRPHMEKILILTTFSFLKWFNHWGYFMPFSFLKVFAIVSKLLNSIVDLMTITYDMYNQGAVVSLAWLINLKLETKQRDGVHCTLCKAK